MSSPSGSGAQNQNCSQNAEGPPELPLHDDFRIERKKITDYLLNPQHEQGGPKSRFFMALGFAPEMWEDLRDALIKHRQSYQPITPEITPFGLKYCVVGSLESPTGHAPQILAVWQYNIEGGYSHFVTAYPAKGR